MGRTVALISGWRGLLFRRMTPHPLCAEPACVPRFCRRVCTLTPSSVSNFWRMGGHERKKSHFKVSAESFVLLLFPQFFRYFPPAVAKVYIVSFRTNDDRRPSKFIVVAE